MNLTPLRVRLLRVDQLLSFLLIASCSQAPLSPDLPPASALLSESCECRERGHCPALEVIAGRNQFRNVACRWVTEGSLASCTFDSRFIMTFTNAPEEVGSWEARRNVLRPSKEGGWCSVAYTPAPSR